MIDTDLDEDPAQVRKIVRISAAEYLKDPSCWRHLIDSGATVCVVGSSGEVVATMGRPVADEDPTQARDREIVESEEQTRSDTLLDLARQCDTPTHREDAIKSLEGVVEAHKPPQPPVWAGRL